MRREGYASVRGYGRGALDNRRRCGRPDKLLVAATSLLVLLKMRWYWLVLGLIRRVLRCGVLLFASQIFLSLIVGDV